MTASSNVQPSLPLVTRGLSPKDSEHRANVVAAARRVLSTPDLRDRLTPGERAALEARVAHPHASHVQLAALLDSTFGSSAKMIHRGLTRSGAFPQGASPASRRQDHVSAAKRVLADPALAELLTPRVRVALGALVQCPQAKACDLAASLGYQSVQTFNASVIRGVRLAAMSGSEIAAYRDRRPCGPPTSLQAANADRTRTGAQRQVEAAARALDASSTRKLLSPREVALLEARVAHPSASLAELAEILGCSKNTCSGLLRRALRKTTSPTGLSEESPTTGVAA